MRKFVILDGHDGNYEHTTGKFILSLLTKRVNELLEKHPDANLTYDLGGWSVWAEYEESK